MSKLMTYSMVVVVIILITAFVLFNFLGKVKEAYAEVTAKQTCKVSVQAHAKLKLRYADFSGEIKCSTVKVKINDKNEEIAKKKLADALYDCWDQFGGKRLKESGYDLFSDDGVYCHLCHRITFDKEIKVKGFMEYLATKNAPGQTISYSQFLTTEGTPNSEILNKYENKKIVDTIDASKNNEYAIIFTYIKGKNYLDEYSTKAQYTAHGLGLIGLGFGVIKVGGTVGGMISATGIGFIPGIVIIKGSLATGGFIMAAGALWTFVAPVLTGVPFEHIALISFIPYDAQSIKNLNCKELPIKQ